MNLFRKPLAHAIAIATLSFATQAQATLLDFDAETSFFGSADVTITGVGSATGLGGAKVTLIKSTNSIDFNSFSTFIAYCFEPMEDGLSNMFSTISNSFFSSGEQYSSSAYTNTNINKLFNVSYLDSLASDVNSEAFQLALWALEYGTTPGSASITSHVLNTNVFEASGVGVNGDNSVAVNDAVLGQAKTYLDTLDNAPAGSFALTVWHNDGAQDFISAAQVPEPASGLLAALGVLGLVAARRKRAA